ncbi:MAG: GLPGLI family protein, partial [Janthinobacterium lividum]
MKKTILLLSSIFWIVQLAIAQKPDQAVALVKYNFSHLRDTTNRTTIYTENMELLIGKNASVYRSEDQRLHDAKMKKLIAETANSGTTGMINFAGIGGPRGSATKIYQYQAEKKLIRQEKIINIYLLDEALPVINWKITSDTTSFGSLHCQKATTTFKGRNYEAWFCAALPFRSGPWKLNGLPGLIVEA